MFFCVLKHLKHNLKAFLVYIILILFSGISWSQNEKLFSIEELQEDFNYWRNRLEKKHPLLYLYTSKSEMNRFFDSIYQEINRPMNELEFYKMISPVVSKVQDGHNVIIPSKTKIDALKSDSSLFPFDILWDKNRLYVHRNLSSDSTLQDGLEIIEINGSSTQKIHQSLKKRIPHEGNNLQLFQSNLNEVFRFYYHLIFGIKKQYSITFKDSKEQKIKKTLKGASLKKFSSLRKKRYEIKSKTCIKLRFKDTTYQTGILTIRTFSPSTLRKNCKFRYRNRIKKYFKLLQEQNTQDLIIDIRGNGGGNPHHVKFLLQHLFNEKFTQAKESRIVKSREEEKLYPRTKKRWYPFNGVGTYKPKAKLSFDGNIIVLIDGGTFSAAVEATSVLKRYNRATFIGKETGGNPIIMCGYTVKAKWKLPNTKIQISPGTITSIYDDLKKNTGRGIIPDIEINPTIEQQIGNFDAVLHYALKNY